MKQEQGNWPPLQAWGVVLDPNTYFVRFCFSVCIFLLLVTIFLSLLEVFLLLAVTLAGFFFLPSFLTVLQLSISVALSLPLCLSLVDSYSALLACLLQLLLASSVSPELHLGTS